MDKDRQHERESVQRGRVVPRWVAPVFLVLGLITIPWVVYLGLQLPERIESPHYDIAWVGFDIALVLALLRTGWAAWRGKPYVEIPAVVTGVLLVTDAWFDVLTTPGGMALTRSVAEAVLVELPLAVICFWVARHAELVREMRMARLRRSAGRLSRQAHRPLGPPGPAAEPDAPGLAAVPPETRAGSTAGITED